MRIVKVNQFGGPEALELIEEATAHPEPGQAVVDVRAAGINFADLLARGGVYPPVPSAPFYPGFEIAGVVSQLGSGVSHLQVGQRVMGLSFKGRGYASQAVLPAQELVNLPDNLGFAEATALLVQGLTAYFLLEASGLQAGQKVLIPGAAGGVGSLAVQLAKLMGAGQVVGLASPSKHELLAKLGADLAIDYTTPGWSEKVLQATQNQGVDIFLDSQGELAGEGFATLGAGGRWMVYGAQGDSAGVLDNERLGTIIFKNITLRGFTLYAFASETQRALSKLLRWASQGQLHLGTQAFPLAEASQAHIAIASRKTTGKVVLVP